ncbi:ATP-binding protein [Agrococcus sp. Ld7]|uniref:ATP-binding protein n=1 Tax=Agrococcus sp. Ld7 TaxID=649148 RepID=UPI00386619ED
MSTFDDEPAPYAERQAVARGSLTRWSWVIAALAIFLTAVFGVAFAPAGTTVAVWWPAAGLSVLLALLHRACLPHVLLLVLGVTVLANAASGRPWGLSMIFGVANAAEVAVIAVILSTPVRRFELSSLRAGLRFVVAVGAGAAAVGAIAAAGVVLLEGGDFWPTLPLVAASHAAAVSLLAPIGALPRPIPVRAGRLEMLLQSTALALVIVLVFQPATTLPFAFAPFPFLAWAALRFPIRFVSVQTIAASLLMLVLALDSGGPFQQLALDETGRVAMFELLLVTVAATVVVLSSAQYELRALARQVEASNRLLTGGVIDASIGLIIAERSDDHTLVRWANRTGTAMLAAELADGVWNGPLRTAAAAALRTGEQVTVTTDRGRTITVAANDVAGGDHRITVQLLDVTTLLRARQVQIEAEVEREAARSIRAELERQRDDFLITTSHELRTPITSIVGYAGLLTDGSALSDTERGWVQVIARNAERLSELVEDLLSFSRLSAGEAQASPERVPTDALFAEVAANLRVVSEQKRIAVELAPGDHAVFAARHDAIRMVSNLVVNACKFTPEEGWIRLSAQEEDDAVRITVADSGPGMHQDELERAFERFYRAPSAERDNVQGTGLGLAIVSELARRNSGSARLRPGDSGGLVAELLLPAAR